jgi:hypothetical protein
MQMRLWWIILVVVIATCCSCCSALRPPLLVPRIIRSSSPAASWSSCRRLLHGPRLFVAVPEEDPSGVVVAFEDYAPKFFNDDDDDTTSVDDTNNNDNIITVELRRHKPSLGCTVEESLADPTILLVSSVVADGYADTAGLRVGDVVTGLTGLFGLVESTDAMDLAALYVLLWFEILQACVNEGETSYVRLFMAL